jgi:hypothetical protein
MSLQLRIGGIYRDGRGRTVTVFEKTGFIEYPFRGYYFGKDTEDRLEDVYTATGIFNIERVCSCSLMEEIVMETKSYLEDNSFNSVEEVFLWLANGNKIQHRTGIEVYTLLTFPYIPSFVSFAHWAKYVEPVRWFHNIPSEGIICWVWDNSSANHYQHVGLVSSWDTKKVKAFRVGFISWDNAIPVTKEELLNRFKEVSNDNH